MFAEAPFVEENIIFHIHFEILNTNFPKTHKIPVLLWTTRCSVQGCQASVFLHCMQNISDNFDVILSIFSSHLEV